MLDKFIRLFFGKIKEVKHTDKLKIDLHSKPRLSHTHNSNAVNSFLSSIKGVGHTEYPILASQYSPSSRIPCTDLVPFISERIAEGDINSIKIVMRAVIEANPGVGFGPECFDEHIESILSIPFEDYVSFPSTLALLELKALFIVNAKSCAMEFMITKEIPRLLSWVCVA